jgi:hypothetical protein
VLRDAQIPFDPSLVTPAGRWAKERGTEAIHLLLDLQNARFDALAAPSDLLAVSAMNALQARNIHVPKEVAVVGIDDSIEGRYATPSLTTMPYSLYEIGQHGVRRLLAQITGQEQVKQEGFPSDLIIRQSCGCLPPSVVQAAVCTTIQVEEPLTGAVRKHRENILADMVQALEQTASSRVLAGQVLDAFVAEIEESAAGSFLSTLDEALYRTIRAEESISLWQGAVSALGRRLLPHLREREKLLQAEDLWQQARVMIGETEQRVQGCERLEKDAQTQIMRKISARLISTFDVKKLMDILAEELPRLGL